MHTGDANRDSTDQTVDAVAAHYLMELEKLLHRVEASTTHYMALGVESKCRGEEVKLAHQWSATMLNPSYYGIEIKLSQETKQRVERAIQRLSIAFSVIASDDKRIEYDKALSGESLEHIPPERGGATVAGLPPVSRQTKSTNPSLSEQTQFEATFAEALRRAIDENRRRCDRIKLYMPVRVAGHERESGKWTEMGQTVDVSRSGVAVRLRAKLRPGLIVHLSLPLPIKLRSYGHYDSSYNIFAMVRRVEPLVDGVRITRLRFIGKQAPTGFFEKPWATFRAGVWSGVELRREPRLIRREAVTIQYITEAGHTTREDVALVENISSRGARLRLQLPPPEFDIVRITNHRLGFASRAVVCDRNVGKDGFEFLSISFTEHRWPI